MNADWVNYINGIALIVIGVGLLVVLSQLHGRDCARSMWNNRSWIGRRMTVSRHRTFLAYLIGPLAIGAGVIGMCLLGGYQPIPANMLTTAACWGGAALTTVLAFADPIRSAAETNLG